MYASGLTPPLSYQTPCAPAKAGAVAAQRQIATAPAFAGAHSIIRDSPYLTEGQSLFNCDKFSLFGGEQRLVSNRRIGEQANNARN